jgi:hypothetical protein
MRGSDPRDVKNYSDCITHETLRVAVVMMAREGPQHMLMSPMLRSVVRVSIQYLLLCDYISEHVMQRIECTVTVASESVVVHLYCYKL